MSDTSPADLPMRAVAADVCVAPQLQPEAMAEAARAGFRSVVNNRPDHEFEADQPTSAAMEAAARAAGLEYRHLPVDGGYQSPEEVAAFAQMLQDLPRPILAFCRSGARSARLYQLAISLNPPQD
jgi:sulfide:quinone oxidoreductase